MTYLTESPEWRARTEREHVPELHIENDRIAKTHYRELAQIHPEYPAWFHLPSQCAWDMLVFCELARKHLAAPGSTYAEVGIAQGGSLLLAAFSGHPTTKLIGIDLFERFAFSSQTVVRSHAVRWNCDTRLTLLAGSMPEVHTQIPDGSVDMFFVDSDHVYETVKSDLAHCWPKVKHGGLLIGHDYEFRLPGCIKAVKEWAEYPRVHIPNGSSMYYAIKD